MINNFIKNLGFRKQIFLACYVVYSGLKYFFPALFGTFFEVRAAVMLEEEFIMLVAQLCSWLFQRVKSLPRTA